MSVAKISGGCALRGNFLAFSHAGDDFAECRDHVKARLVDLIEGKQENSAHQTPPRRPTQAAAR